jgi:hypothetical protein
MQSVKERLLIKDARKDLKWAKTLVCMYIFLQNKKNIFAIAKCLNFNAVERQTE